MESLVLLLETICLVSYDTLNLLFIGLSFHIIMSHIKQTSILAFEVTVIEKHIALQRIQIILFPFVLHLVLHPQAVINQNNCYLKKALKERLQQGTAHASNKCLHENSSKCCLWSRFLDSKTSLVIPL